MPDFLYIHRGALKDVDEVQKLRIMKMLGKSEALAIGHYIRIKLEGE